MLSAVWLFYIIKKENSLLANCIFINSYHLVMKQNLTNVKMIMRLKEFNTMMADNIVHGLLSMWKRHAHAAVVVGTVCGIV